MSLDNRPHEYYIDANCEQMKNHSADFCLPGRQSLAPLHGSVWRGFQGGQPHPCLVASVMGNDQPASTSPWQLSPALVDSYSHLLVATKSCLPCFQKDYSCSCYLLWVSVFDTVTQMKNARSSTVLGWDGFSSVCSLWWKNSVAFSQCSPILLQMTANPENPRKMQWCGADRVEVTDCTAQESLWLSYLK